MVRLGKLVAGGGVANRTQFSKSQIERLQKRYQTMADASGHVTIEELCLQPETVFVPLFGMFVRHKLRKKAAAKEPVRQDTEDSDSDSEQPLPEPTVVDLTTFIEVLSAFSPGTPAEEKLKILASLLPANEEGYVEPHALFRFYHGLSGGLMDSTAVRRMCDETALHLSGDKEGGVPQEKLLHSALTLSKLTVHM